MPKGTKANDITYRASIGMPKWSKADLTFREAMLPSFSIVHYKSVNSTDNLQKKKFITNRYHTIQYPHTGT